MLQLQTLASKHKSRKEPLAIVANLVEPATEDVLWHMTLSYHAELKGTAAAAARGKAEAAVAAAAGKRRNRRNLKDPAEAAAQAVAAVQAPVSLHLLRKRELMSGMLTQVTDGSLDSCCCCCLFWVLPMCCRTRCCSFTCCRCVA